MRDNTAKTLIKNIDCLVTMDRAEPVVNHGWLHMRVVVTRGQGRLWFWIHRHVAISRSIVMTILRLRPWVGRTGNWLLALSILLLSLWRTTAAVNRQVRPAFWTVGRASSRAQAFGPRVKRQGSGGRSPLIHLTVLTHSLVAVPGAL